MKRSTPLTRSTPLAKKSSKSKRWPNPRCSFTSRCHRTTSVHLDAEHYCKTHATDMADSLVGTWVKYFRDAACVSCGSTDDATAQWCHVRSRGARYIRWYVGPDTARPGNSVRMCARCHQNFTLKPAEWDRFVERKWPGLWTRLVHLELAGEDRGDSVDIAAVIVDFRQRVAA